MVPKLIRFPSRRLYAAVRDKAGEDNVCDISLTQEPIEVVVLE